MRNSKGKYNSSNKSSKCKKTKLAKKSKCIGRFITFNVLSPHYAKQYQFPLCKPEHLDRLNRLNRLMILLESWFRASFVISLQELCVEWKDSIRKLCKVNSYKMIYKTHHGGKMGVAILYPNNTYRLIAMDVYNFPKAVRQDIMLMRKISSVNSKNNFIDKEALDAVIDSHTKAENRPFDNCALTVLLQRLDRPVEVQITTAHAPCRFTEHYYMALQLHAILRRMSELRSVWEHYPRMYKKPVNSSQILMGDFNTIPSFDEYGLLNNSDLKYSGNKTIQVILRALVEIYGESMPQFPTLCSAYSNRHGSEPQYTNVKIVDDWDDDTQNFMGTTDYIFVSPNVEVRDAMVGLTPKPGERIKPYPNAICPSDHLSLSATIELHKKQTEGE